MDLDVLKCFIAVSECLNFTRAAEQLYLNQSVVSRKMSEFESEIGCDLLKRNKRSVSLTCAGRMLLPLAKDIVRSADKIITTASLVRTGVLGQIKIGFIGNTRDFIPEVFGEFHKQYPEIELDIGHVSWARVTSTLVQDKLDIACTFCDYDEPITMPSPEIFDYRIIGTLPMGIVASKDYPFPLHDLMNLSELSNQPFIMINHQNAPLSFRLVHARCARHGFLPNVVIEPDSPETMLVQIACGLGISILPCIPSVLTNPSLQVYSLNDSRAELNIALFWKKSNQNPSLFKLLDCLNAME